MLSYIIYMIPVFLWIGYSYVKNNEISAREAGFQLGFSMIAVAVIISLGYMSAYTDNGIVVGKLTEKTSKTYQCDTSWSSTTSYGCKHYETREVYDGQTCTTSNGKRSCQNKYKTEYRHYYPWERDYFVHSDVSSPVEIKRDDMQGYRKPSRWISAEIGEPFASTYRFDNFVRASKASLFNKDAKIIKGIQYPVIYDYYRTKPYINGSDEDNRRLLTEISDTKTIVLVFDAPQGSTEQYAEDFAKTMSGHKMYDIVIVKGETWVNVRSWSKTSLVNYAIRDHVLDNDDWITGIGDVIEKEYVKPNPEDFEYLRQEVALPMWAHILAFLFIFILNPVITYFLSTNSDRKNSHSW